MLTRRLYALRTVGGVDDRSRRTASRLLATLGFFVGLAAWSLSAGVFFGNHLFTLDEAEDCRMATGYASSRWVGTVFAPQATCVWFGGAIELVSRSQIAPVAILWALSFGMLLAALILRGLRGLETAWLPFLVVPLLFGAGLFTWTTGTAWLGPIAEYTAEERPVVPPREPTWEERDGWSFVIPVPASTANGSYADSLAAIGPVVDSTMEAVGPIPHPWDPEHEPVFPTSPVPCDGVAERPVFEASFTAEDNAGAVLRARELWQELGYEIDDRSTASHVVAVDPTPVTGTVLSIEHYDKLLRVQVSGVCGD